MPRLRALVEGRLSPEEFETVFLSVFRGEGDVFAERETQALHELFTSVDAYCADPALRDDRDLDEVGLAAAASAFVRAVAMPPEPV
ncbi:colicin immunity domain-containing protein [Salinispora arenicola]|uniref:colicin immunity domain-containing protein n=1 Tax=Salinispora arenicola TaxID=168697 RepID=UPI0009B7947A